MESISQWWYGPQPETKFEKGCKNASNKLETANKFIENHQIDLKLINHIDKVAGGALGLLQLSFRFWTSTFGFVAGGIIKKVCDYYEVEPPREMSELIQKIENLWAKKGVRTISFLVGIILIYANPDFISLGTPLAMGTSMLAGGYTVTQITQFSNDILKNKQL
ncbi:MAG: hypothetical protein K940chlam3_01098 [Chlamydiae bacterium]|nr:hypothetical protein [Chlamydiota bacterium]